MYLNNERARRGLSLIEILVAISIVAILCMIAFSGSRKIRESALNASTLSNLRQMAQGALLMASDSNGILDMHESEGGEYKAWVTLPSLLYNKGYIGDKRVFFSAHLNSDIIEETMSETVSAWTRRTMGVLRDNSRNPGFFQPVRPETGGGVANGYALRLSETESPGDYPILVDSSSASGSPVNAAPNAWVCWFSGSVSNWKPVMRDGRHVLMAFADGHVEAASAERLSVILPKHFYGNSFSVMNSEGRAVTIEISQR